MWMMFIFFFCDEYFHISCNSLYAGEDKDNFYLDMSTEEEILIFSWSHILLMSLLICHFLELDPITCLTYVLGFGPWELFSDECWCKVGFSSSILFSWAQICKIFFPLLLVGLVFMILKTWSYFVKETGCLDCGYLILLLYGLN